MFWNILNASIYMKYKIKRPAPINCTIEKNIYRKQGKKFQRKTNQDQWKRVHVHVNVLTNCSRIPLITERVQRTREVMQVTMMRQSNVTVRYMFLEAERKRNQNHLECEKHHDSGVKLFGFGKKNSHAPVTFQSLHSLMSTSSCRSTFILPLCALLLKVIFEPDSFESWEERFAS